MIQYPVPDPEALRRFLDQLCLQGILTSPAEQLRLHNLMVMQPDLTRIEIRRLLIDLIAKNERERDSVRRVFDRVFPPCEDEAGGKSETSNVSRSETKERDAEVQSENLKKEKAEPKPRNVWIIALVCLLALGLVGGGYGISLYLKQPVVSPPVEIAAASAEIPIIPSPNGEANEIKPPVETTYFNTWVPAVNPVGGIAAFKVGPVPSALLFFGSALLFFWLWQQARQRTDMHPGPLPETTHEGHSEHPPVNPGDFHLLGSAERRDLAWSVNRYVEDLTARLDLGSTVTESARHALPSPVFQEDKREREIHLWIDRCADPAQSGQLVDEIARTLKRAGVEPQLGYFSSCPDRVLFDNRVELEPVLAEGVAERMRVAILTDGAGLFNLQRSQSERVHRILSALRLWPQLCLVNIAGDSSALPVILKSFGLICLPPPRLAAWLAGEAVAERRDRRIIEPSLKRWAAACALPGRPISEAEARLLHDRLGLDLAWHYAGLDRYCQVDGRGLSFTARQRRDLLRFLAEKSVEEKELLKRALEFWEERYTETAAFNRKRDPEWEKSLDYAYHRMERAMLALWRLTDFDENDPEHPLKVLYALDRIKLFQPRIRDRLREFAAADFSRRQYKDCIFLPWLWRDFKAGLKIEKTLPLKLLKLNFAGHEITQSKKPSWDRKTSLVLGLLAGITLTAFGVLILELADTGARLVFAQEGARDLLFKDQVIEDNRPGRLIIGTPKHLKNIATQPYQSATVEWCWTGSEAENLSKACQGAFLPTNIGVGLAAREPKGDSLIWRAGTLEEPIRACAEDWPARSIAVIVADKDRAQARDLAAALLDQGSADLVVLGVDGLQQAETIAMNDVEDSQWLFFSEKALDDARLPKYGEHRAAISGNFTKLREALSFAGAQPIKQALAAFEVKELVGRPRIWGGRPKVDSGDKTDANGTQIDWIGVCGGTFTMGSRKSDEQAYDDEKPAHPVVLKSFKIAATETTNVQYDPNVPPDQVGFPKVNIFWKDARDYCRGLGEEGDDLPSEAQWEYAARGGSQKPWSFGDDEAQLCFYGNGYGTSENSKCRDSFEDAAPVKLFQPNPSGLYDMHGNVYEWVVDCWDDGAYQARKNSLNLESRIDSPEYGGRVLRGGSFRDEPRSLRSARRRRNWNRFVPDIGIGVIGFRCVRASGRQH